jgi:hypothetical protein
MHFQITKQRAMALMGIESSHDFDDIVNQHEQKLFEWKQEILQKFIVPSLLRKKQNQLTEWIEAEKLIVQPTESTDVFRLEKLNTTNRVAMLEQYEADISLLKLKLTQAEFFSHLPAIVQGLLDVQENYMQAFVDLFSSYSEALPEEVNSREIIDTGKLLFALKQDSIDNKLSWAIEREISRIKKIQGLN